MLKDKFYTAIATGFWVGKIPFMPGTWGSLLGVFIWLAFSHLFIHLQISFLATIIFWFLALVLIFILGIYSSNFYSKKISKEDPGEIVIDEICGQLLTFFIGSFVMDVISNFTLIFLSFVFFRLFDITKPFIIGLADKNVKGGLGVMMDDLLAGAAAAVSLYCVFAVYIYL
ncbi:MAG: p [Rickettsiaceae bacterium]|jgi:phosphatidylglycerophosphatase A|nr:p [Rickettsiaceae bacterium]